MYSGGSGLSIDIHFVDIELSYDVLSPLPIVLSKHFNHPHPYIEIATAISDDIIVTGVDDIIVTGVDDKEHLHNLKEQSCQTLQMRIFQGLSRVFGTHNHSSWCPHNTNESGSNQECTTSTESAAVEILPRPFALLWKVHSQPAYCNY